MEKTSEEDQRNSTVCVHVPKVIDARNTNGSRVTRISANTYCVNVGILSFAQQGDRWLADKGFMCSTSWITGGQSRNTSKVRRKETVFCGQDVHNQKNSQVRVHLERGIRQIKVFKVLRGNIPLRYSHLLSCGSYVAGSLCFNHLSLEMMGN